MKIVKVGDRVTKFKNDAMSYYGADTFSNPHQIEIPNVGKTGTVVEDLNTYVMMLWDDGTTSKERKIDLRAFDVKNSKLTKCIEEASKTQCKE